MAIILAANTGNWTDAATWAGGIVPSVGDVAVANGKTVTIDASVTCAEVRNDTTGGATGGGYFQLSNGATLTANVYGGASGNRTVAASSSSDTVIVGDVFAGTGGYGARNPGTYTLTIIGTVYGNGYGPGSVGFSAVNGAINASTGLLLVKATQQGARGMPAVSGPFKYLSPSTASAKVRATAGLTEVTLRTPAGVCPAPADVQSGTSYGGGTLTGYASRTTQAITPNAFSMSASLPEAFTSDEGALLYADDGITALEL